MFVLTEMKHDVRIAPNMFGMQMTEAIVSELNKKLANKVLINVGLCIALHDLVKVEDSYILPGDGAAHVRVTFRYVVFRPFMNEVILGHVRSSSREGVQVTLGFFDDILIPPAGLMSPSTFKEDEQVWSWQYKMEGDDGETETHEMYMDPGEPIRFKVMAEKFTDTTPSCPDVEAGAITAAENTEKPEAKIPYRLIAQINEGGLGLLSWWAK